MPNNFVFDTIAQDLKTQIYGTDGVNAIPIRVDASGNLDIGVNFTSLTASLTAPASGTGIALTLDSSEKSLYSFYAMNSGGTAPITVKLQVSPTTTSSYFVDDSSTPVLLNPLEAAVLVPKYYLNYTRLFYANNDTVNTASLQAFCDARE
jgi:hypothetical protein